MDRSLYPEGVEVRQVDLSNTEDTRAFHILQRNTDNTNTGVVAGLIVTPNGATVDISIGYGYAPNGELVQLLSGISGVALSDYTLGVHNYILLVYTETNDDPRPHKTSGDSLPTRAVRDHRLVVVSKTAYNLLLDTDDNLDNNAKDRSLVVAIVTAQGDGVSLVSSNIELATTFGGGITAQMNMSGVSIIRISDDTITGTGSLDFAIAGTTLIWVAPGDTSGAALDVSSGGVFSLVSQPSGATLTVLVADTILPTVDTTVNVVVTNIYQQNILRNSALDYHHRSFIGSGIPAANNPHGLTPGDLGLGETNTEFHQEVFHSNGISPDSASDFLEPIVNVGSIPHDLDFTAPIAGDKLYLGGFFHNALNGTSIQFSDVTDNAQILFNIYAAIGNNNSIATLEKHERVRYVTTAPPLISSLAQLRDASDSCPVGTAQIEFLISNYTLKFKAPGDASFGPAADVNEYAQYVPGVMRLYNETGECWIEVYANEDSNWSILPNTTEDLLITALPLGLEDRLKLCATMFSGSSTGFLGNGFDPANGPNNPNDKRVIGLTDGVDIKAGFHSFGSGGVEFANHPGGVSIGDSYTHPSGKKVCLTLGERNVSDTIPLKILPVDVLPTNLTREDRGTVWYYGPAERLYLWRGSSWSAL